jgi:predicted transcriptional regulator
MIDHNVIRTLKIGIASRDEMKARTMAIARGECRPSPDDPKVWFTSVESLAQVLSTKNRLLLELIARSKPASMADLARLTVRRPSNLSRTLSAMQELQHQRQDDAGDLRGDADPGQHRGKP